MPKLFPTTNFQSDSRTTGGTPLHTKSLTRRVFDLQLYSQVKAKSKINKKDREYYIYILDAVI